MKKFLLAVFMLTAISFYAQSTDLDPFETNYSYIKLPNKPILEKKNRSYSFLISFDRSLLYNKSKFFIENQVTISGLEKKEKNGYMTIEVMLQNPVVTKKEVTTRTVSNKDRNGYQTTKYYYTPIVSYTQQGNAKIISSDGKVNKIINFNGSSSLKGTETEIYSQAQNSQYSLQSTIVNNYLNEVVNRLNNELNEEFGYQVKTGKDQLWILANKKHPEQEAEYNAYLQVKAVFDKMNFAEPVEGYEKELEGTINYFKSLSNKYTSDSKGDRKIRYSAYYNLAKIYAYLDQPAKSNDWANLLITNDYDSGDGKSMIKENDNNIALFNVNQLKTRHFPIDTKNFIFEESVPQQQVYSSNNSYAQSAPYSIETDQNYSLAYILTIKKDTVTGYMQKNRGLNLSDAVTVTVKDFQGKYSERNFKANEVTKLILSNGEEFATVAFKVSSENGGVTLSGSSKKFAKEMYVGKKIAVYQYFNGEIIIKGASDSEGKSNASASWMLGPKKRFEELAAGCQPLLDRVDKKEFKNNLESILSFAQALDECK
jgi:hypothetical protein